MVKLVFFRRYPFVRLYDEGLARQVARLTQENSELRERIAAAQQEKGVALQQSERLRSEKERLRRRVSELKQAGVAQRKEQELLLDKFQRVRAENEALVEKLEKKVRKSEPAIETSVVPIREPDRE